MPHSLQISRKLEYGTRAMAFLASLPEGLTTSFREIARRMDIPEEFLAKILKTLVKAKLVRSTRGAHGGYRLARAASQITFLEVLEALEGPITVNVCTDSGDHEGCAFAGRCSLVRVWEEGQAKLVETYRKTRLDRLAMRSLTHQSPLVRAAKP